MVLSLQQVNEMHINMGVEKMEDKHVCRAIEFCYNQKGFTIIINDNKEVEYISYYEEISDGNYTGGLKFLFGEIWRNQTDEELINLFLEKYERIVNK